MGQPSLPSDTPEVGAGSLLDQLEEGPTAPVIISLTPNGALRGPESSPHIPETSSATAEAVGAAYDAGASIVHLHARDPQALWRGATRPEDWYTLHQKVRDRCPDIIIMDSTEGDPGMSFDERTACLEAGPEVASLTLHSETRRIRLPARPPPHPREAIELNASVTVTDEEVDGLAAKLKGLGIKPELELKSAAGMPVVRRLVDRGLIAPPYMIQTVLGYPGGNEARADTVLNLLQGLPADSVWLCLGKGEAQLPMTTLALEMGGHVRVGLEDALELEPGRMGSNVDFVRRTRRIAAERGRDVATPAQARQMLGLNPKPSRYP